MALVSTLTENEVKAEDSWTVTQLQQKRPRRRRTAAVHIYRERLSQHQQVKSAGVQGVSHIHSIFWGISSNTRLKNYITTDTPAMKTLIKVKLVY